MPDRMPNMVALVEKPKVGRPKKFDGGCTRFQIFVPDELIAAAWKLRDAENLSNLPDAVRELLRAGAEARGLVGPRE